MTRAYPDLPDTSDFLLTITDASGNLLYEGKYGDCPESMKVNPGTYNVRVLSSEFVRPAFDAPQFGDEQCVHIPAGGVGNVRLLCSQMNAGVRLDISSSFLTQCPDAVLFLKSDTGKLMYSYSEKRTAFFSPGTVSLMMSAGGKDEVLMTRRLQAREMALIGVSVPLASQNKGCGISISVDTARVWTSDECIMGAGDILAKLQKN